MNAVHSAPRDRPAEGHAEVLLRVDGIKKSFGRTQALSEATFELRAGEVHALAGENGSGKSTLVKILSGVHLPDAGTLQIGGRTLPPFRTPRVAQDNGVATVFQEVIVAEARSVLDNIWLGGEGLFRTRVSAAEKRSRGRAMLDELIGRPIDLGDAVEYLSLSDRQACGIVRALLRNPRILILDEATSALDLEIRDRLFSIVRRLSQEGVAVIFITHRMDEIREIADRITVMRSGRTIALFERDNWTSHELVQEMTGADQLTAESQDDTPRERVKPVGQRAAKVALSAEGLRLRPGRQPFDVTIRAGELVGVAGLEGHGQHEFLDVLRGAGKGGGDVVRHDDSGDVVIKTVHQAAEHGIAYVPRERSHAVFPWMSIRENFGMPTLKADTRAGALSFGHTSHRFDEYVRELNIVLGTDRDRITSLSGGNQQKVVIARWLAAGPTILLLNDPTRGIDIGAKRELYVLLTDLADHGLAVVMLSSELDEHVELMDRVLVFREHQLSREIPRAQLSRQALGAAFFGEEETHVAS